MLDSSIEILLVKHHQIQPNIIEILVVKKILKDLKNLFLMKGMIILSKYLIKK